MAIIQAQECGDPARVTESRLPAPPNRPVPPEVALKAGLTALRLSVKFVHVRLD